MFTALLIAFLVSGFPPRWSPVSMQVFFYRCLYLGGDVKLDPSELCDYRWVTKDELKDYFSPELLQLSEKMLDGN
jgi:NADH pyrophosphatase NudC (nudix superfamily)